MNQQQQHIQFIIKVLAKLVSLPQTNSSVDGFLNSAISNLQKAMAVDSIGNQDVEGYYAEPQRLNATPQQKFNNTLQSAYSEANQAFNKKRRFEQMIKNNEISQRGQI